MAKLKLLLYLQVCVAHKLEAARSTERRPNKELGVSIFCDYLDFFSLYLTSLRRIAGYL